MRRYITERRRTHADNDAVGVGRTALDAAAAPSDKAKAPPLVKAAKGKGTRQDKDKGVKRHRPDDDNDDEKERLRDTLEALQQKVEELEQARVSDDADAVLMGTAAKGPAAKLVDSASGASGSASGGSALVKRPCAGVVGPGSLRITSLQLTTMQEVFGLVARRTQQASKLLVDVSKHLADNSDDLEKIMMFLSQLQGKVR